MGDADCFPPAAKRTRTIRPVSLSMGKQMIKGGCHNIQHRQTPHPRQNQSVCRQLKAREVMVLPRILKGSPSAVNMRVILGNLRKKPMGRVRLVSAGSVVFHFRGVVLVAPIDLYLCPKHTSPLLVRNSTPGDRPRGRTLDQCRHRSPVLHIASTLANQRSPLDKLTAYAAIGSASNDGVNDALDLANRDSLRSHPLGKFA